MSVTKTRVRKHSSVKETGTVHYGINDFYWYSVNLASKLGGVANFSLETGP